MNWVADDSGRGSILQKPDTSASDDRARDMYIRPSLDTKDEATQEEPYATILDRFGQKLPSFDACVVIGYSFRDPHISEELVKFARSGKIIVLLSPTATSDFDKNALKGDSAAHEKGKWTSIDHVQAMFLDSEDAGGVVYALNKKLSKDNAKNIAMDIKSLIAESTPSRRTAAAV